MSDVLSMRIDRCVCFGKPFSLLKEVAVYFECSTVEALQNQISFGENCKMCHPYVRRMLATGETVFDEVLVDLEKSD